MQITAQSIIGDIVAQDYRAASVLKSFEIDFCCKGNRTIDDVCRKHLINSDMLIREIHAATRQRENLNTDYQSWELDLLAYYIEKKHHRYTEKKISEISPYLEKIASVHGDRHPELIEINELFKICSGELAMHMKKEELVLFPYIRKMVKAKYEDSLLSEPPFGSVENPVAMMRNDHDAEGERFRTMAALSRNYTPPADACNTYRVTYALLKEFEEDLHLHIHLENNILFPKAIALERLLNIH